MSDCPLRVVLEGLCVPNCSRVLTVLYHTSVEGSVATNQLDFSGYVNDICVRYSNDYKNDI